MISVPPNWDRGRIKWDTTMIAGATPSTEDNGFWLEGDDPSGTPFVAIADMSRREHVSATAKSLSMDGLASRNMPVGQPGTLLFAMYASVGEVAFLDISATWNQALLGITPDPGKVDSRFLRYVLLDMRDDLLRDVRSNTQSNLNARQVGDIWFQKPPLPEQRSIADYLDRETGRIDTLIQEQQRLISMLRERRDSVWAEYVEIARQRARCAVVRRVIDSIVDGPFGSSLTSAHYSDDGARVIRLGNIGVNEFKGDDVAFIPLDYAEELKAHAVEEGDVVVAGLGDDRMPLGRAAVVPELGPAIVKADCYRLRPNEQVSSAYLAWVMSAPSTRSQIMMLSRGSTRARLNTKVVQQVAIPLPDRTTQDELVASSDADLAKIDGLITEAERFIEISLERRSAMITAAVTGQFDVRGMA